LKLAQERIPFACKRSAMNFFASLVSRMKFQA
jgi:hypothetical protein